LGRNVWSLFLGLGGLVWLSLTILVCNLPALAQSQQPPDVARTESSSSAAQGAAPSSPAQAADSKLPGSIGGTVADPTGALLAGAQVRLMGENQSLVPETLSGDEGQFSFSNIAPGPFRLTITSAGFAPQTISGILHPGEACVLPQITLAIPAAVTEVSVVLSQVEVAEAEIKEQEKQRALGFIPNFYVSYVPNAAPLSTKQKFELAWKTTVDPVSIGIVAGVAGVEQAADTFHGYGQGAQGYGKRFGAAFADSVTGTFIGGAILPSLLKQDPRYFYKGTGSKRSRLLYALANAVICKSDKGRWQPNYSAILGNIASGGISNLYYPPGDRGAGLVFQNAFIGIGANAVANVFQEFVVRRFTPNLPQRDPPKP
jgi:hypothetical protein